MCFDYFFVNSVKLPYLCGFCLKLQFFKICFSNKNICRTVGCNDYGFHLIHRKRSPFTSRERLFFQQYKTTTSGNTKKIHLGLTKMDFVVINYSAISVTTPEPTVLPPSRIANLKPFSIAIGVISSTFILTLSPGIHISTPSGREITPVTSVVLK